MKRILILLSLIGLSMICNAQTDDIERQLYQLDSLVQNEEYDKAFNFAEKIDRQTIDRVSDTLQYIYYVDNIYIAQGLDDKEQEIKDIQNLINHWEKYWHIYNPYYFEWLQYLGLILEEQNNIEEAIITFEKFITFWGSSEFKPAYICGEVYLHLANLFVDIGYTKDIEVLYLLSYQILKDTYDQDYVQIPRRLVELTIGYDEYMMNHEKTNMLWEPLYYLGLYYQNDEQYENAIYVWEESINSMDMYGFHSFYPIALYNKSLAYFSMGDTIAGIQTLGEGLNCIKDSVGIYNPYSKSYLEEVFTVWTSVCDSIGIDTVFQKLNDYYQYDEDKDTYVSTLYSAVDNLVERGLYYSAQEISDTLIALTFQLYGEDENLYVVLKQLLDIKLLTFDFNDIEELFKKEDLILANLDALKTSEYADLLLKWGYYKMINQEFVQAKDLLINSKKLQMDLFGDVSDFTENLIIECNKYINE